MLLQYLTAPLLLAVADHAYDRRVLQSRGPMTQPCVVYAVAILSAQGGDGGMQFHCELDPQDAGGYAGQEARLDLTPQQAAAWQAQLRDGTLVSGAQRYLPPAATANSNAPIISANGVLSVPPGLIPLKPVPRNTRARKLGTDKIVGLFLESKIPFRIRRD